MAMNKAEQDLLGFLDANFLLDGKHKNDAARLIRAVWQSGMRDAAEITKNLSEAYNEQLGAPDTDGSVFHPDFKNEKIYKAILTAANKPDSNPNPRIVFHGKEPE